MDCWCFYRVCSTITIKVHNDIISGRAPFRKRYTSTLRPKYYKLTNIISHLARTEHLRHLYSCCFSLCRRLLTEHAVMQVAMVATRVVTQVSELMVATNSATLKPRGWTEHGAEVE